MRSPLEFNLLIEEEQFYEEAKLQGKSLNTQKNYKTDLECFNQFLLSVDNQLDLSKYQLSHIEEYGPYLNHRYDSDNSRRRRVQTLRQFFDFLVSKKLMADNFVKKIAPAPKFLDIPRPTPHKDLMKVWNYLQNQEGNNELSKLVVLRNQLLFLLIYSGGLKVSDLTKIPRSSIIPSTEGQPRVMVNHKSRDPYTIPLHPKISDLYLNYVQKLEGYLKKIHKDFPELLFYANHFKILSGGLTPRGLEAFFEEVRNHLKIEMLTPKSIRQAGIFTWLHEGYSETSIKEWLGVGTGYTLKPYRDCMAEHIFSSKFLYSL